MNGSTGGLVILLLTGTPLLAAAPHFEVLTVEGRRFVGPLVEVTADSVTVGSEKIATVDLVRCEQSRPEPAASSAGAVQLLLVNGDRLRAEIETIDEEFLVARWGLAGEKPAVRVPLEQVQAVILGPVKSAAGRRRVRDRLRRHRRGVDLVLLGGGDRISGEFGRLTGKVLELKTESGARVLPRQSVAGVAFNAELFSVPPPPRRRAHVELKDGSRLTTAWPTFDRRRGWLVRSVLGRRFEFAATAVRSIQFAGGRSLSLSSVAPVKVVTTPFQGRVRPLAIDRSVSGRDLLVRGRWFASGLGMSSRTVATWTLDGSHRWFVAAVAIDDSARGGGSVVFRVRADSRTVFTSPQLTGRDKPLPIPPVDLSGVRQLVLEVDYGRRADVRDHAAWLDPRLVGQP